MSSYGCPVGPGANLKQGRTVSGHHFVDVPFFLVNPDGKKGMLRRQCTNHYKINPIYRHIRKLAGGTPGRPFPQDTHVEMWLGISLDEVGRMKPSREPWAASLAGRPSYDSPELCRVVRIRISGAHCLDQACVINPYRSDEHWLELKHSEPTSYDEAVRFDRWLRQSKTNPVRKLLNG